MLRTRQRPDPAQLIKLQAGAQQIADAEALRDGDAHPGQGRACWYTLETAGGLKCGEKVLLAAGDRTRQGKGLRSHRDRNGQVHLVFGGSGRGDGPGGLAESRRKG